MSVATVDRLPCFRPNACRTECVMREEITDGQTDTIYVQLYAILET